jgi:glycosyltransferase involved in cell wall biosynthesis
VHNGIDISIIPAIPPDKIRQGLGIREGELVIGSMGSLVKRKRFDDLINAISYIRGLGSGVRGESTENPPKFPFIKGGLGGNFKGGMEGFLDKIKCIIIGDGPEREYLQKKIDKNGLNDKVMLTGFKSEAISYINALDIFVLPSEREGFPRVILEAMLMGKPVIASKAAGSVELVIDKETGFLFHIGNTKELAESISTLLSSPELRREMGERGMKRVTENFSIEKYVSQVSKVLNEVAG